MEDNIILVTGIADARPLKRYMSQQYKLVEHVSFGDHHRYTTGDLERLLQRVGQSPGTSILTTEKDMVKLSAPEFKDITTKLPLFYLPIEVEFLKNGKDFDEMVLNSVRSAS
jgi:tetraacyldisaccharide 4'-kinase